LNPETGHLTRWALPEIVGAVALAQPGCVVLALQHRLAFLDLQSGVLTDLVGVATESGFNRLNEGRVSPSGRWFLFGSMDDRDGAKMPTGNLYRAELSGEVVQIHQGLTITNGLAWTPDGHWVYFSDSYPGTVWRATWDEATGCMGQPQVFTISLEAAGRPDGALIDNQGHYVSAGVSAGCINVFAHDGALMRRIDLPVKAPSMPCIGGRQRDRLFVTSLVRPHWDFVGEYEGALLELAAPWAGPASARWQALKSTT
jgi:sugar lactone lactonase YvrE